jgi:hypothetical protein
MNPVKFLVRVTVLSEKTYTTLLRYSEKLDMLDAAEKIAVTVCGTRLRQYSIDDSDANFKLDAFMKLVINTAGMQLQR